jgi:hypothetical protein
MLGCMFGSCSPCVCLDVLLSAYGEFYFLDSNKHEQTKKAALEPLGIDAQLCPNHHEVLAPFQH